MDLDADQLRTMIASMRRKHKYGAKPQRIDGKYFASTREATRWCELLLLEKAGEITDLEYQPEFPLIVNDHGCGLYRADSKYRDVATGEIVVEDVKSQSTRTAVYKLKRLLVEALFGIIIREV